VYIKVGKGEDMHEGKRLIDCWLLITYSRGQMQYSMHAHSGSG